jgi:hypothetical protein
MKGHAEFPELDQAIEAHARAVVAANRKATEAFVASAGRPSHDDFLAKTSGTALKGFTVLGRARIGFRHMSKVQLLTAGEPMLMLNQWRQEDGKWQIASTEDLSGKRSPWSDIETLAAARAGNHSG